MSTHDPEKHVLDPDRGWAPVSRLREALGWSSRVDQCFDGRRQVESCAPIRTIPPLDIHEPGVQYARPTSTTFSQDQFMTRGFLDRPDCRLYYEAEGAGPVPRLRPRARRQSHELVAAGAAFPRPLHLRDLLASRLLAFERAGRWSRSAGLGEDLAALVDHLGAATCVSWPSRWAAGRARLCIREPGRVRALVLASTGGSMAWPAFPFAEAGKSRAGAPTVKRRSPTCSRATFIRPAANAWRASSPR